MPDNIKKCGLDPEECKKGEGGIDCWNDTHPTMDICAKCTCLTCDRAACPPSRMERERAEGKKVYPER